MEKQLNEAIALFEKYRLQEAQQILEYLVAEDDKNIDALLVLGKIHIRTQQYGDAINCFNRVLELEETNSEAKTNLVIIKGILQLVNNFYFENSYTDEELYEFDWE